MYSAFGLLKPESDFTMTEAARRLAAKFPAFAVEQLADAIVVSSADWEIHLTLNDTPAVLEESRAMAERIGGAEDAKDFDVCARRVELASDIPDPEMEHFNDYLLAVEVLRSFNGLIAVDPREPSLLQDYCRAAIPLVGERSGAMRGGDMAARKGRHGQGVWPCHR